MLASGAADPLSHRLEAIAFQSHCSLHPEIAIPRALKRLFPSRQVRRASRPIPFKVSSAYTWQSEPFLHQWKTLNSSYCLVAELWELNVSKHHAQQMHPGPCFPAEEHQDLVNCSWMSWGLSSCRGI